MEEILRQFSRYFISERDGESFARGIRELEEENLRLKKMYADLSLDNQIIKEILAKKGSSPGSKRST